MRDRTFLELCTYNATYSLPDLMHVVGILIEVTLEVIDFALSTQGYNLIPIAPKNLMEFRFSVLFLALMNLW